MGGGHAHALALRMLAMNPVTGLRITLVSLSSHTPYSGMLPGLIAGHYRFEDTHIDLARLCQWAGARFIAAEVISVDPLQRRLILRDRPPLAYDILSLDTGSEPELDSVPGAREHAVPVKPVHQFWQRWQEYGTDNGHVVVVGGGAGGVEIALAMAHARRNTQTRFSLLCGSGQILGGYSTLARRTVERSLATHGITLRCGARVESVASGLLSLDNGEQVEFDQLFWCTGAAPGRWIASSGLPTDERGFVALRDSLQVVDHDTIFAAGDVGTQLNHPRPKAGVYAVRQGPVLAHNLAAYILDCPLRTHRPQQRFLSLVSLGGRRAVADRGPFSASGAWVWRWKDRIDRAFMNRFHQLEPMDEPRERVMPQVAAGTQAPCGGCGAKVGAGALAGALAALAAQWPELTPLPGTGDDAARVELAPPGVLLQSVDVLRELVSDPFLMGRIAAQHAMSDIFAMGARPVSALASVALPFAVDKLLRRELEQLLAGALTEFAGCSCRLLGGHSIQGAELSLGFTVNGVPTQEGRTLGKGGFSPGDQLILTKPLGSGVLFAAQMQQLADGRDIESAVRNMLHSNAGAAGLAVAEGVTAATDITGFGLAGHLLEMLADDQGALLRLASLPVLAGVAGLLQRGIRGSAHEGNAASSDSLIDWRVSDMEGRAPLLFDAQTSGGLLLGAPPAKAASLLGALVAAGCGEAAIIGEVTVREGTAQLTVEA